MKRMVGVVCGVLLLAVPVAAHHSWTVEYDGKKPVTVKGTVSKVEWTNPHTHIYVDARDASGTVTTWNFEMASTLSLERGGWSRKTLPVGTEVTVGGYGGRAETTRAIANSIVTAEGKSLFVATPGN
jgi:DNA/RNA endonuclease YhcR with UshA esterase domain